MPLISVRNFLQKLLLVASGYHTCVLRQEDSNDAVTCFGSGVYGQLGDGTFLDLGDSPDEKLRSFSLRFFFSNLAFK